MRFLPAGMGDALDGASVVDARLRCDAWYDGDLVAEDLSVESWSMDWSRGPQTQVQGTASFTVVDDSGLLAPWGYDEPLSVAGSQIRAFFEVANDSLEMGSWLITSNKSTETWRSGSDGVSLIPSGASIPVGAAELTQLVQDARFMAPESPQAGGTVFSELRRLLSGIVAVIFTGVTDRAVPSNMVYREERINTVFDLAGMIGEIRMTGDGLLEVYNPARTAPVWEIKPGVRGNLIQVGREQSRASLYNAVVATSQDTETEIRQWSILDAGSLRFYGPLGTKPMSKTSMAATRSGVLADAQTTLTNRGRDSTTLVQVFCAPNPMYQIGDWGQVLAPIVSGEPYPLVGQVTGAGLSGSASGVDGMSLELECATDDVQAIARHVRRGLR